MTKTKAHSKNTVFLQVFRVGPGFRGTQNGKKWEEIGCFGTSDWKFPIETLFFYLGAFPAGPPNFFCPTWFCDFCARSHQSRAFENHPSQKTDDDENEGTFIKHRFPAGFSCEAWVSGGAKRQKMGRNRIFRDLRLEISNPNAVFQSWGLPGRTSELFFPHLVLRFSRSGVPNQRVQKLILSWPSLFPLAKSLFVSCFPSGARFCRGKGMFLVFLPSLSSV